MPNQNLHIVHALMSAIFNYFLFLRIKILRELKLKNKPLKKCSSQNRSFPWSHEPRDENQKNQANAFISLISDLSWKLKFWNWPLLRWPRDWRPWEFPAWTLRSRLLSLWLEAEAGFSHPDRRRKISKENRRRRGRLLRGWEIDGDDGSLTRDREGEGREE